MKKMEQKQYEVLVDKMFQIKKSQTNLGEAEVVKNPDSFLRRKILCFPCFYPNCAVNFEHSFVFLPLWPGRC